MPVIDGRGTRPVVQSGDLAFLQQKEQEGKLKSDEGFGSAIGDLCILTAGANRDIYLAKAHVVAYIAGSNTTQANGTVVVELKANGVTLETYTAQLVASNNNGLTNGAQSYEFNIKAVKVSATQIIKLEVISIGSGVRVEGSIQGWEESSGSQQFGGQTVTFQSDGGDLSFLRNKSRDGDLVELLSSEFSADADQITFVPPNGKTFYLFRARLYPVVNTIITSLPAGTFNRRADIEITNDGVVIDVLTHDQESSNSGGGSASSTGQYESNLVANKLIGDGLKEYKLVSTNISGTYRVSLVGWLEDT